MYNNVLENLVLVKINNDDFIDDVINDDDDANVIDDEDECFTVFC